MLSRGVGYQEVGYPVGMVSRCRVSRGYLGVEYPGGMVSTGRVSGGRLSIRYHLTPPPSPLRVMGKAVVGTHPTGMLSSFLKIMHP